MRNAVLLIILIAVVSVAGKHIYLSGFWYTEPYTYDDEFNPLFITVLAYHLVHTVRIRLKHKDMYSSWSSIRKILSTQNRITVSMQCKNGDTVHIRKSTQPESNQQDIYSALDIRSHPGKTIKTTIPVKRQK